MTSSIEIVIATHTADRPVERAARSVLQQAGESIGVAVVAHNLPLEIVTQRLSVLPDEMRARVRLLEHHDGLASAAGPMNAGIRTSDAVLVGVLGSDDWLQPGSLQAWRSLAEAHGAEAVMARVVHDSGALVRTPPVRWGRRRARLALAKDRLAYRTAPLGLMRREVLVDHDLWFTEGLSTGDDVEPGIRLWARGKAIYAPQAAAYVVGADAAARTTTAARPVEGDLACVVRAVGQPWFKDLAPAERLAVVVKFLRINVFSLVAKRHDLAWEEGARSSLSACVRALLDAEPQAARYLSIAEARLLEACTDPAVADEDLKKASVARLRHGRLTTVVPRSLRASFASQGPLRLMVVSALMR